jgi:hypothetical protein
VLGKISLKLKFEGEVKEIEEDKNMKESNTLNFKDISIKGKKKLRTKWGHQQSEVEFLVVRNLSTPILLGFPSIERLGMSINTREGNISIGNDNTELILPYKGREEYYVYNKEDIILQPNKRGQVFSIVFDTEELLNNTNDIYLVESNVNISGIQIVPGIISKGPEAYIPISNFSNSEVVIEKGSPIGVIKKVEYKEEEGIYSINENTEVEDENIKEEQEFREDRKKSLSGKGIGKKDRKEIRNLLNKHKGYFARKINFRKTNKVITPYKIRLKENSSPVIEAMGRLSPDRQEEIDKSIQDLADRGLIEEGNGAWRSRVLLVKKPDGSWRTTIDYRKLNSLTIPDSYPMPRIDDMLDRLNGSKYFSKLDMTDGFWQILLDEESKEYTGFATTSKFWQWKVLPMGAMNSPSAFQRAMDQVLGELKWKSVMCYVDDLIIFSKTIEEHLVHIEEVLNKLKEAGVYSKLGKCQFGVKEIKFLGHVVSSEGIKADSDKVKAIQGLPTPKDEKAMSRFLGMAGFYRKYIKNFSARTINMRNLTRNEVQYVWNKECEKEFKDIKGALSSSPVMAYPNFKKKFILSTDASYSGLGATLSQMGDSGEQVIAYASRSLNQNEKNYGVTKLEALGVVWAIDLFKVYLQDNKFDLITDHKALVKFKEMKDTNPTLERWSIKISQYDFDIFHREGKKHENVDCLSRDPVDLVMNIGIEEIAVEQQSSEEMRRLYEKVIREGLIVFEENTEDIEERELRISKRDSLVIKKDGRIFRRYYLKEDKKDRLCIPKKYIPKVLAETHNHHHFNTKKTYEELKDKVWWDGMYKDTKIYCDSCKKCGARNSPAGNQKGIIKMVDVTRKGEMIAIDLMTPGPETREGNKHVLVITEYATKYALAIPIPDKTAITVAKTLWDRWICIFGCPEKLISDNGGEFTGEDICKALIQVSNIKHQTTTPYNPRANGQVERFNKTLANSLAKKVGKDQVTWDQYVATVCMAYNITKHSATGVTPAYLMFGQEIRTPLDHLIDMNLEEKFDIKKWKDEKIPTMLERLKVAQEKRKTIQEKNMERKNKDKVNKIYKEGEKVWVREEPRTDKDKKEHKKLRSPWIGPFTIGKTDIQKYGNTYKVSRKIADMEEERVINISNLKDYVERPDWMKTEEERKEETDDEEKKEEKTVEMEIEVIPEERDDDKSSNFVIPNDINENENEKGREEVARDVVPEEKYIPILRDLVDVQFNMTEGKRWACGKVTKVDRRNIQKVFIEFEDSHKYSKFDTNDDWYNFKNKEEAKVRRCENKDGHIRSDEVSIMNIKKKNYKKKKLRKRRMHKEEGKCLEEVSERMLDSHTTLLGQVNEVSTGDMNLKDLQRRLTGSMQRCQNTNTLQTQERANKEGSIVLSIRDKQFEVKGGVEFLVEFLGKVSALEEK